MIPGEIITADGRAGTQRRPRDAPARGRQYRRPADPGRLALSLLRDQRRAANSIASRRAVFVSTFQPARRSASSRASSARCELVALGGRSHRVWLSGPHHGAAVVTRIERRAYAEMFGPTTGDRIRLGDTELWIEIERDHADLRRGSQVRRRQGDPRRHGSGPARGRRGGRHRHHQRRDPRSLGHRQGRRRPQGRPHRRHRQGRQSRHSAGRDHRHRSRPPRSLRAKA